MPFAGAGPARRVITPAEIQQSGATNAWEALERNGATLTLAEEPMPEAARSRLALARLPRVVVDGIQMLDIRLLRDIPAGLITRIRILSGLHATTPYGTVGTDIIVIETRRPVRR